MLPSLPSLVGAFSLSSRMTASDELSSSFLAVPGTQATVGLVRHVPGDRRGVLHAAVIEVCADLFYPQHTPRTRGLRVLSYTRPPSPTSDLTLTASVFQSWRIRLKEAHSFRYKPCVRGHACTYFQSVMDVGIRATVVGLNCGIQRKQLLPSVMSRSA